MALEMRALLVFTQMQPIEAASLNVPFGWRETRRLGVKDEMKEREINSKVAYEVQAVVTLRHCREGSDVDPKCLTL